MKIATADRLMLLLVVLMLVISGLYYYFKVLPIREDLDEHTRYTIAEISQIRRPKKGNWTFLYVYSVDGDYFFGKGTIPLIYNQKYRLGRKILIRFSDRRRSNSEPLYHFVSDTLTALRSGWKELPEFLLEEQ